MNDQPEIAMVKKLLDMKNITPMREA